MGKTLALDFGSGNTLLYQEGAGIIVEEPTVCITGPDGQLAAFGRKALDMRAGTDLDLIQPVRRGAPTEIDLAEQIIRLLLPSSSKRLVVRPTVVIAVPEAVTPVKRRAFAEVVLTAGASHVYTMGSCVAAAIGANLPIHRAAGVCIAEIGAETTCVSIMSLGGVVSTSAKPIGMRDLADLLKKSVRDTYGVMVSSETAERAIVEHCSLSEDGRREAIVMRGRSLQDGTRTEIEVKPSLGRRCAARFADELVELIKDVFSKTPPDLAQDIIDTGITLSGGGALLKGLDRYIAEQTNLSVHKVTDPLRNVVKGAGISLASFDELRSTGLIGVA